MSRRAFAVPLQIKEGKTRANVDTDSAAPKEVESGSRFICARCRDCAFHEDRARDVGVGRDPSRLAAGVKFNRFGKLPTATD